MNIFHSNTNFLLTFPVSFGPNLCATWNVSFNYIRYAIHFPRESVLPSLSRIFYPKLGISFQNLWSAIFLFHATVPKCICLRALINKTLIHTCTANCIIIGTKVNPPKSYRLLIDIKIMYCKLSTTASSLVSPSVSFCIWGSIPQRCLFPWLSPFMCHEWNEWMT